MSTEQREVDISVVILTYFHEPYIAQCLAGFLPRYLEDGGETNKGS